MRCTTPWPALFLMGLASTAYPQAVGSTVATDFASATNKALLTAEAASWKEAPAAATIWVQVGSLYGSAVISLFGQTTPHARTTETPASSSAVHGLSHHKTVSTASCNTSFDYIEAASAVVPISTAKDAIATGLYRFANASSDALANQSGNANSTVNAPVRNATTFNTTNFNPTNFNPTAFNTTTFNTTTFNATTGSPSRGPIRTQLPTGISLFSSGTLSTHNGASTLLLAALLQAGFVLLL